MPGSALILGQTGPTVRINGGVNNSEILLIEGMDATNSLGQGASQQNQPGTDSIQEWAIQTSNFAAEYGQVGNAIMNVTMKSGTNQFHGSAYDYYVNEFMNAGQPFTNDGNGHLVRTQQRRNDYGFTIGGPISIPKLYNGHDRTFFFFSWEQYRVTQNVLPNALTVPTSAFRNGDFSLAELTTKSLGNDPAGRPIFGNEIYDPTTRHTVGTSLLTDPFPNNTIPLSRIDPVAAKIQALIPNPTNPLATALVNNYQQTYLSHRNTEVPSLKIDQTLSSKDKLSFFWNMTKTFCAVCSGTGGSTGLPVTIDTSTQTDIHAYSVRLNYDRTVAPTVLLHLGAGFSQNWLGRPPLIPDYDATAQLGLTGPFSHPATFPVFQTLCQQTAGVCTGQGGMANMGTTAGAVSDVFQQPSVIASITWVKNNHTFKFGGETRIQGDYNLNAGALNGTYTFSNAETAMPYVRAASPTSSVAGQPIGFNYASFLLGLVDVANAKPTSKGRIGKSQWGFYAQDNWKITHKLTLDIGLRYDYSTYLKEQYGRTPTLDPNVANPNAGGHPGGVEYEATCNCNFANNYKFGFGPRLGLAYQVAPKTVLRAGFGIVYTGTPQYNLSGAVAAASNPIGPSPDLGAAIMKLSTGVPLTQAQIVWPNFNPAYYPINAASNPVGGGPPNVVDQNSGRPGRQYQWSIGLQRELFKDLLVEAAYVGNRAVWLTATSLVNYNELTPQLLSTYGLSLSNPADLTILAAPLNSAAAGRFQNKPAYAGFPLTQTVAQSLRPFPQFSSGLAAIWAPLGKTWYDSLQINVTKRLSHGLDLTYAFTWSKELDNISGAALPTDVQNYGLAKTLSANSRPLVSGIGFNYTVPGWSSNKFLRYTVSDWTIGGFLQYATGLPIGPPLANASVALVPGGSTATLSSLVFQSTVQNRVPGVPLFTHDLNCHCFDPKKTFALNPAAWTNPAAGTFGTATYYGDYRQQRRPLENMSFGRRFRMREKMSLNVRIEFTNIFNRTFINNPTSTSPQAPQVATNGKPASGLRLYRYDFGVRGASSGTTGGAVQVLIGARIEG